jgi:LysR family hydrogen peroxide-inducible transcriptional activator
MVMVTLKQLRYFGALARHRHFGRAAEACSVTQPALSMQVKELEAELGARLVERGPGLVTLTDLGTEVAERADRILAAVADLVEVAGREREPLTGSFRLGIIPSVAPYLLPRLLPALQAAHPSLALEVQESLTATLMGSLERSELDAALIALPPPTTPHIETRVLFDDEFYLAVPAGSGHGWTGDIRHRLAQERLLLLEEGHCLREQALQFCRLDAPTRRTLGATSLSTILQMVGAGFGVTLLPALAAQADVPDGIVDLVRFPGEAPMRTLGLAWRSVSARRSDVEALAAFLITLAQDHGWIAREPS